MSKVSGWELVGIGTPTPHLSADQMFTGDDPGWINIEKRPEYVVRDHNVADSQYAVYRDPDGNYHTVGLAPFDDLEGLEDYVDDVLSGEYA